MKRLLFYLALISLCLSVGLSGFAENPITSKKIENLSFRNKNLKTVFQALSTFESVNIFFDEQVRDTKVSINISGMTFDKAVELLLKTHKLFIIKPDPNTIIIIPNTPEKREQYQEMTIKTFYLVNAEAKNILNLLRTMLGTRQIFVNERLNALVVRDSEQNMVLAEKIIKDNDKLARQVDIELELFEVNRESMKKLGVQLSKDTLSLALDENPLDLERLGKIDYNNLITTLPGLIYNIMKESNDTTILANPRVRITNRQKAKIVIADRIPLEISTSTFNPEGAESIVTQIQYKDVGIKFSVEPTIHLDDKITIKLDIEVSSIVGESAEGYPTIRTRNVNTFIRLNNRETKVLGGLISDSERTSVKKIPLLGDLPYLGSLFSSKNTQTIQTEIVMAITPRIIEETESETVVSASISTNKATQQASTATTTSHPQPTAKEKSTVTTQDKKLTGLVQQPKTASPSVSPPSFGTAPQTTPLSPPKLSIGGTKIYIEPGQTTVNSLGEKFEVFVQTANGENVFGASFHLYYDRKVVNVVSVEEGDFFKQNHAETVFVYSNDKSRGRTVVGVGRRGKTEGASGSGTLVKITFKSVNWGSTNLTLSNELLVDPKLNQVKMEKADGVIHVAKQ